MRPQMEGPIATKSNNVTLTASGRPLGNFQEQIEKDHVHRAMP